jgi:hypothetical protein
MFSSGRHFASIFSGSRPERVLEVHEKRRRTQATELPLNPERFIPSDEPSQHGRTQANESPVEPDGFT